MGKLNDSYYDAIVISDEIDTNHEGAVRIKILGITDNLKNEDQPFALPSVDYMMAVPTKGSYLKVSFDEGDINKPKYFAVSAQKSYLPQSYVEEYPNISVNNLGGDDYIQYHDRNNKNTLTVHPSNATLIWNNFGEIVLDSENAYNNTGTGANEEQGTKIHSVLTEASIDIFTCKPFGRGIAKRGSEYLSVAHISKATVDAINGTGAIENNTEDNQFEPSGVDTSIVNNLYDTSGNITGDVTFMRSPSIIEIDSNRQPKTILIGMSGNNDFVHIAKNIISKNTQLSVHYLVGKKEVPVESGSAGEDIDMSGGFAQFVELKNDATYGSNLKSKYNSTIKGNKNSISIMLIGNDYNLITQYQRNAINTIIEHVKYTYKLKTEDMIIQEPGYIG